jgi:hypothetical protein
MIADFLKKHITSQAKYPEVGFGQVEPNHLSAQYTGQIYAQLPADPAIEVLEQGQFVKYDYAKGLVNFTGEGEWMLVYNEIKLYRDFQRDCEFAMLKGNYEARVYSPLDGNYNQEMYGPTRFLQGKREAYDNATGTFKTLAGELAYDEVNKKWVQADAEHPAADYSVASNVYDYYEEMTDVNAPGLDEVSKRLFMKIRDYKEKMMPAGTTMVPRVFKTNIGDHYTTNMINEVPADVALGDILVVGETGILCKTAVEKSETFAGSGDMKWQVVKVYTMPDHQKGVKVMRIA